MRNFSHRENFSSLDNREKFSLVERNFSRTPRGEKFFSAEKIFSQLRKISHLSAIERNFSRREFLSIIERGEISHQRSGRNLPAGPLCAHFSAERFLSARGQNTKNGHFGGLCFGQKSPKIAKMAIFGGFSLWKFFQKKNCHYIGRFLLEKFPGRKIPGHSGIGGFWLGFFFLEIFPGKNFQGK